ncbi:MAG TPA: hypothetical protein QF753_03080 [Victivallales bacterium]|nr:hypothetical protein [Victivallales bacterium]
MKRYFIFISCLLGLSLIVNAADSGNQKDNFDPVKSIVKQGSKVAEKNTIKQQNQINPDDDFKKQIINLENQRREVSLQIYELRIKLIQNDPDLKILHKTIVDLHEKMAKQLNGNSKMEILLAKAKKVDGEMTELITAKAKEMNKKK